MDRIKTQTKRNKKRYKGQSSETRVTSSIPVSIVTEKASTANLTVKEKLSFEVSYEGNGEE